MYRLVIFITYIISVSIGSVFHSHIIKLITIPALIFFIIELFTHNTGFQLRPTETGKDSEEKEPN